MEQKGSLVETVSPIHCIRSQVLCCVEQNCLDIIVVYNIVTVFVSTGPLAVRDNYTHLDALTVFTLFLQHLNTIQLSLPANASLIIFLEQCD